MVKLKYVGDGSYFPGVPASDHEQANEALAERLVFGGLYEYEDGALQEAAVTRRERQLAEEAAAEAAEREAVAREDALATAVFGVELGNLTVAELKARAEEEGIELPSGAKKAEIITTIEDAQATEGPSSELGTGTGAVEAGEDD